jgi:hypothetical protein
MQAISTYLIAMLTVTELGLGIVVAGVLAIGIYQSVAYIWFRTAEEDPALSADLMRSAR